MDVGFEITDHTADAGIRAFGPTREDVFEQAALAMFSLICDPATVKAREDLAVVLEAPSDDLLLAAWLNELLFLFETRRVVFASFALDAVEGGRLWGHARGEKQSARRHEVRAAVKGATYHGLELRPAGDGWEGTVLLDV